jgi:hypothetical protein
MKGSTLTRNSGKAVMTGNTANAPPAGRAAGKESAPVKTITMTDVAVALGLPLMAAIAWLAPARSWRIFSRLVSPFYAPALATNPLPTVAERMARVVAERPIDGAPEDLIRDLVEEDILSLIELLRDYRFDRWTPPIEVRGLENVEAARERGRGAILWVSHFVHCDRGQSPQPSASRVFRDPIWNAFSQSCPHRHRGSLSPKTGPPLARELGARPRGAASTPR